MRCVGTIVRGIRTPIIKEGDDLASIVVDSVIKASESEGFDFCDKDVIAVTEAVVGISEGNFATLDQIAKDIKNKLNSEHIGVVYPILSRIDLLYYYQLWLEVLKRLHYYVVILVMKSVMILCIWKI